MATGLVQLVGTLIGTTGDSGFKSSKVIDRDFTTGYFSSTANGQWIGFDAGVAVTVRHWRFTPFLGSTTVRNEIKIVGGKLQISSAADFLSDVTDVDTVPAFPFYLPRQDNTRPTTSPASLISVA